MNWSFCGGGGRIRCRYTLQVYRKVATSVCTGGSNMPLACCKLFFRIHLCPLPNKKAQSVRTGLFAWWGRTDSNHRSETQQIYRLSPLATRELPRICRLLSASAEYLHYTMKKKNVKCFLKKYMRLKISRMYGLQNYFLASLLMITV